LQIPPGIDEVEDWPPKFQVVAGFRPADLGVARWDAEAREE